MQEVLRYKLREISEKVLQVLSTKTKREENISYKGRRLLSMVMGYWNSALNQKLGMSLSDLGMKNCK